MVEAKVLRLTGVRGAGVQVRHEPKRVSGPRRTMLIMPDALGSGWRSRDPLMAEDGDGAPGGPQPWHRRFGRWAPPATMAAVGISLVVHLVLWIVAAFVLIGGAQAGGAGSGEGSGAIGVAVMTETELGQLKAAGIDADSPAVAEAPSTALPGADTDIHVTDAAGGGGTDPGLGEGLGALTSGMGAGDISGGPGLGTGGAGGGAASFFGVEARGTRFAYVIDISGSMDLGVGAAELKRIDILKTELGKSVQSLLENAYFFVALFSSDTKPLGGRMEWIAASDAGKAWGRRTIPLIQAEGETKPVPAFHLCFSLRPKPDAIYFMTDGEFDKDYANQIARLNADFKIPIHCITFVSKEGEEVMRKIAADSGGTYTHFAGPGG